MTHSREKVTDFPEPSEDAALRAAVPPAGCGWMRPARSCCSESERRAYVPALHRGVRVRQRRRGAGEQKQGNRRGQDEMRRGRRHRRWKLWAACRDCPSGRWRWTHVSFSSDLTLAKALPHWTSSHLHFQCAHVGVECRGRSPMTPRQVPSAHTCAR